MDLHGKTVDRLIWINFVDATLGANLQQVVREIRAVTALLPDSLKQLGKDRLNIIEAMIRGGSSEEDILALMKDPKYLGLRR